MTQSQAATADDRPAVAALAPLVLTIFSGFLAVGLPLPILSLQVHDVLGFDAVTAGWIVGLQSFATIATRQVAGSISDAHGPKRAVLVGLPLASLAGCAYAFSTFVPDRPVALAILIAGRLMLGFAESLFLTGCMAWGIARVGARRTGKVMAWQGIAMFAALGLGGPVGIAIMQQWGFVGIALVAILLPLLGLAVACGITPAFSAAGERVPFYRVIGLVWRYGVVLFLASMPYATLTAFVALYFASRGWSSAGFALTGFGAGYIVVRLFFAHLPDRLGGGPVAAVSIVIEALGQLILWLAPDPWTALAGATLTGIGFSLVFPALGVEALKRVAPQSRGMAVAGYIAFLDLALGLTSPLAGLLIQLSGAPAVFLAGALKCLLAVVLTFGFARNARVPA
jgi:MFS family permease